MSCFNLNQVNIAGRVTADIELKSISNGGCAASFSIAINRRVKAGEEQQTDFINVSAFGKRAEFAAKYFKKGSAMFVSGCLKQNSYTAKDGTKRNAVEVLANDIKFIDSKKDAMSGVAEIYADNSADDDVPF